MWRHRDVFFNWGKTALILAVLFSAFGPWLIGVFDIIMWFRS